MEQEIAEATAEVAEVAAEISLYQSIGESVATVLLIVFSAIILYRCFRTFYEFIYTGNFGDENECFIYQLMTEHEINKYTFIGTSPQTILIDAAIFLLISILSILVWAPLIIIGIIILAGYLLRKHIAKKQDFVAKLDGTHPDLRD